MTVNKIKNKNVFFQAPPSKAYTLRSLVLSSLAEGESKILGPLLGQDQLHLIGCLKNLGVEIKETDNGLRVNGNSGNFKPVFCTLNCGESGVSMNVLTALACLVDENIILTGSEGLLLRPIGEVVNGVKQLSAEIEYLDKNEFPPISVKSGTLSGGYSEMSGSKTSQYFTSLAMITPYADNITTLVCTDEMSEKPYFDITQEMMSRFGVEIVNHNYKKIEISPRKYRATEIDIESDYSSASFFMLAAAICNSKITIHGLNKSSKQGDRKMLDYLSSMGCSCKWVNGELEVTGDDLNSIKQNMKDTPDLVPPMAIAAAFAEGVSEFTGVGHLQYKECNRLEAVIHELGKMGIRAYFQNDTLFIEGNKADIKGYNNHQ